MFKTTVYLPERLKRRLGVLARRRRASEAELIRSAVERLVEGAERPRPRAALFHSGDPTLAARVDELLKGMGR